jgi:hypothetical protein
MMTVQQVRNRFFTLLREGKSSNEASRIANQEARESNDGVVAIQPPAPPPKPVQPGTLAIPANWADLPWPDLRTLAEHFVTKATGKEHARSVIEGELANRRANNLP